MTSSAFKLTKPWVSVTEQYFAALCQELNHLTNNGEQVTVEALIEAMGDVWPMTGGIVINNNSDVNASKNTVLVVLNKNSSIMCYSCGKCGHMNYQCHGMRKCGHCENKGHMESNCWDNQEKADKRPS